MNQIVRKIFGGVSEKPKREKIEYPITYAFAEDGTCVGVVRGRVSGLEDFDSAEFLNIKHRNGKVTVVRKNGRH